MHAPRQRRTRIRLGQRGAWWRAWFEHRPECIAEGMTPPQAVGQLILDWHNHAHLEITHMPLEPITFRNVQPGDWDKICRGLAAEGLHITTPVGTMERGGVEMRWVYDPGAQTLTVQCLKKPWIFPAEAVQSKLRETFDRLMRS